MFSSLSKTVLFRRFNAVSHTSPPNLRLLHFFENLSKLSSFKYFSSSTSANQHSFTAYYLISTCGLSPESALAACRRVHFTTPDKPNSVLAFLKKHGFSKTQILNVIRLIPEVLLSNPDRTLLPKIEFFSSIGFSSPDVACTISRYPWLLKRSVANHFVPLFDLLKHHMGSDVQLITVIKHWPCLLYYDYESRMAANIRTLRDNGVPESSITLLFKFQPRTYMIKPDKFKEIVEEVKRIGGNPLKSQFVLAVFAMSPANRSKWGSKVEAYKKWGWSEKVLFETFARYPWCMMTSEDKIMTMMDFFVNKMGWEPLVIAKCPILISFSLKKRIIPRASVIQYLLSKGLLNKNSNLISPFCISEKKFLHRFVSGFVEAPLLLKLYKQKVQ